MALSTRMLQDTGLDPAAGSRRSTVLPAPGRTRVFRVKIDLVGFWIACLLNGFVAYWSRWRLVRERGRSATLSGSTAILIWITYLGHLTLTLVAASAALWPLALVPMVRFAAGGAAAAAGIALFVAGTISFGSFDRMSGRLDNRLVTHGVYRWSRNPQNAGWLSFLLGVSLLGRSGLALALTTVFWIGFVTYVPREEQQLERQFGDEYRKYRRRSHRYFGPMRRQSG